MKALHWFPSPVSLHLPPLHIGVRLHQGLEFLLNHLAGEESTEPQIWQHQDRQGHEWFEVYEPHSHHHFCFSSEQEVRDWLDQRFYL
ncbi:MAG: hypothetical protein ACO4CG_07710 [Prochlorothrix sp.]|nr:hypothetical protein [Prochlorothrix sp.]